MLRSVETGSDFKSIPMLKLFSQLINECSKLTSGTRLWFESPLLMQSLVWAVGSAARGSNACTYSIKTSSKFRGKFNLKAFANPNEIEKYLNSHWQHPFEFFLKTILAY